MQFVRRRVSVWRWLTVFVDGNDGDVRTSLMINDGDVCLDEFNDGDVCWTSLMMVS